MVPCPCYPCVYLKARRSNIWWISSSQKNVPPQAWCDQDQTGTITCTAPLYGTQGSSSTDERSTALHSTHTPPESEVHPYLIPENVAKPQIIEKSNLKQDNKTKLRTSDEDVMLFPGLFGVFSGRGVQELIFWWLGWLNSAPRNTVRAIVSY